LNESISQLISDNRALLDQLIDFLLPLTPSLYQEKVARLHSGSIGGHVRHILDHYQSMFKEGTSVNYDERERCQAIEQDAMRAVRAIRDVQSNLSTLPTTDSALQVICSTSTQYEASTASSSLSRELMFVHSHTTHHMAIIRLLAICLGNDTVEEFGKAPSTLKFEQNVQS
jgi:uncharacterized damage-inducible protein DinB